MSLLSIIIPNYNHSEFLPRCLDSIFAQDQAGVEVLVCDDGSSDGSLELLRDYQLRQPSLRVLQNPQNLGVMATLRHLYGEASADYILGLGADDSLGEGYLALVKSAIEQHHPPMIFTDIHLDFVDSPVSTSFKFGTQARLWSVQEFIARYRRLSYFIGGSTIYRADLMRQELATAQELGPLFDFWINHSIAFTQGGYHIPGEFCCFTVRSDSYGHRARNRQVYRKFLDFLSQPEHRMMRDGFRQSRILRWHGLPALLAILASRRDYDLLTLSHVLHALKTWLLTPVRRNFPGLYGKVVRAIRRR